MSRDEEYLVWKNWENDQFCQCSKFEAATYRAEIKKTGLNSIQNVVEIGFGNGGLLAYSKMQNWDVIGVELNDELVSRARAKGIAALPFHEFSSIENEWADLIVAIDVFEHIEQKNLEELLTQIRIKLKPGGVLLARFPNADSPFGLVNQNGDFTHATALGSYKVEYLAKNFGFEISYIGGESYPVFCGHFKYGIQRAISNPIRYFLEKITHAVFFPTNPFIKFFSINTVIALKKAG
ncbi:MAG: class I SAM-dependent methyltransferase [Gallionellaceae bacterium]|jgi:SAM-dependent methyltransferase